MYVCTYNYIYTQIYAQAHTHALTHTYAHTRTHTHTHTHTRTHTLSLSLSHSLTLSNTQCKRLRRFPSQSTATLYMYMRFTQTHIQAHKNLNNCTLTHIHTCTAGKYNGPQVAPPRPVYKLIYIYMYTHTHTHTHTK